MKNLQFNIYQCGAGWDRLGLKRSKSIPVLLRGAGLKSYSISTPSTLQGGENPCGVKWGGTD